MKLKDEFRIRARKRILHTYFSIRNSWPVWFYGLNLIPRKLQKRDPIPLTAEMQRIVRELDTYGIAISSLSVLFPGSPLPAQLTQWVETHQPHKTTSGKKEFLREYWEIVPTLNNENPFLTFALSSQILGIANAYLRMWTKLTLYDLRKTLPQETLNEPKQSQQWHRDPEEKRMLKCFIYMSDVSENAGPFTYARKSTYGKHYGNVFPQRPPEGSYPPPDAVEPMIPVEERAPVIGPPGTVIFCDTTGLHFGGRATTKERIMSTVAYNSPAFTEGARYVRSETFDGSDLSPQARYAVETSRITGRY